MLSKFLQRLPYIKKNLMECGDGPPPKVVEDDEDEDAEADYKLFVPQNDDASTSSFTLDPINRFFAAMDPEMWEISEGPPAAELAPKRHHGPFPSALLLPRLLAYVRTTQLKSLRRVCRLWDAIITTSPQWRDEIVAVIDGETSIPWLRFFPILASHLYSIGAQLASYLDSSRVKFRLLGEMRIRNVDGPSYLSPILTSHGSTFGRSVKHVTTLSLLACTIPWIDFLELLYLFSGVKQLSVVQCNFGSYISPQDKFLEAWGFHRRPHFFEILEHIESKCPVEEYLFSSIKALRIQESEEQDPFSTCILLNILKERTTQLDTFVLQLGLKSSNLGSSEDQASFWASVHSFLGMKNVAQVQISSPHLFSSGMANKFFSHFSLWKPAPVEWERKTKSYAYGWRMAEFVVDLNPLTLWPSVHRYFIPLIHQFPSLRLLSLKHILLRGEKMTLIQDVVDNCPEACRVELGLILDDQGPDASSFDLSSQLFTKSLHSLNVFIHTDGIREVRDLVQGTSVFPTLRQLTLSTNGLCRPRFFTFNIHILIQNFPHLTQLSVLDGPPLTPANPWKSMSGAVIGDDDLQLILKHLTSLKKLVIRANMQYVTDYALTGLSPRFCRKWTGLNLLQVAALSSWQMEFSARHYVYFEGECVGGLRYLRDLAIEGVGQGVSDVTALFAFRGLNRVNLDSLAVLGAHKFGFKECMRDGSWFKHPLTNVTWSNYTSCINLGEYEWRSFLVTLYEWGYLISILALVTSLIIFFSFKCLDCTRVTIHKHLFFSFIINNVLWLSWYRFVTGNQAVLLKNPGWCKGLHILVQYFLIANYFWMACEGFYLHTLLVHALMGSDSALLRRFYAVGWVGPVIPIAIYLWIRLKDDSHEDLSPCWTGESGKGTIVLSVAVALSLALNLAFLINIIRVLVTKLSHDSSNNIKFPPRQQQQQQSHQDATPPDSQYSLRKAVRATLILVPLLGLHYLLIPIRPPKGTHWETVYDVVAAAASSLQGFSVAILFCFCNSEVLVVFKRKLIPLLLRTRRSKSNNTGNREDPQHPMSTHVDIFLCDIDNADGAPPPPMAEADEAVAVVVEDLTIVEKEGRKVSIIEEEDVF